MTTVKKLKYKMDRFYIYKMDTIVEQTIRKLVAINDAICRGRSLYSSNPMYFNVLPLINVNRPLDWWKKMFVLLTPIDLIRFTMCFDNCIKYWPEIFNPVISAPDDTSEQNLFYIDLIQILPQVADYGWNWQVPKTGSYIVPRVTGVRKLIEEFTTPDDFVNRLKNLVKDKCSYELTCHLIECCEKYVRFSMEAQRAATARFTDFMDKLVDIGHLERIQNKKILRSGKAY